ncbi:tyrosine-type recombinase/integrase [Sphingomonas sp. 28-63-12]|uniref:tyrosine-type recombinase/integrase n=1 Tax=Sphingomonas sp. 28-63-12 TaxID=1970434 RepID=UPI000BD4D979|nr:MAG: hypothetical protein B7Y47_02985 [Sphingomonas sp. 28-63-12]
MTLPAIKGLYITGNRKPGKPVRWYVYAWRGGPLIAAKVGGAKPRLDADIVEKYHAALQSTRKVRPESFASLIADYRRSPEWSALATSTRRNWSIIVDRIEAKWGSVPTAIWSDPRMVRKVIDWRDAAATQPRKADNQITVLRHLLEWARLRARVNVNVAAGIPKLYHGGERAEIIWTEDELTRLADHASADVIDGVRLACLTGLRRADLVALTWAEIGERAIVRKALKSSKGKRRTATVPIVGELRTLLAMLRTRPRSAGVETVLVNSHGQPWTGDGFGNSVIRARNAADIRHEDGRLKHLHDCRGTFATKLMTELEWTDEKIAAALAWAPDRVGRIRSVYVDVQRVVVQWTERSAAADCQPTVNRRGETL